MAEEIEFEETHSEEMQDIIGKSPRWIVRRGNLVISIIIGLVITAAWMIEYPDIVSAPIEISVSTPPIKIIARSSGRIIELKAEDGDFIKKDEVIAVLDNTSNTKDVLALRSIVSKLDTTVDISKAISLIELPSSMQLGDMQASYASLFQAIDNYRFLKGNSYYADVGNVLKRQQKDNSKLKGQIVSKLKLHNEQLQIERWKDSINRVLLDKKIISLNEYNSIKKQYLLERITNNENNNSILQANQQEKQYQISMSEIEQQYRIEEKQAIFSIREEVKRLKGLLATWEHLYVLRSPADGVVTFFRIWKENQYASNEEPIFMVTPAMQDFIVRAELPILNAGKVKSGQRALIKLSDYPYQEFGILTARVTRVTNVSLDSFYSVHLELDQGFKTSRNYDIPLKPQMYGTTDFITRSRSVFQRIFDGLYGRFRN